MLAVLTVPGSDGQREDATIFKVVGFGN